MKLGKPLSKSFSITRSGVLSPFKSGSFGPKPRPNHQNTEHRISRKAFADAHVYHLEEAPHAWLLPRCCGALYHGGANTVGAVALAGIPGAIAPVAWDQPWWAEYMETLGVWRMGRMGSGGVQEPLESGSK